MDRIAEEHGHRCRPRLGRGLAVLFKAGQYRRRPGGAQGRDPRQDQERRVPGPPGSQANPEGNAEHRSEGEGRHDPPHGGPAPLVGHGLAGDNHDEGAHQPAASPGQQPRRQQDPMVGSQTDKQGAEGEPRAGRQQHRPTGHAVEDKRPHHADGATGKGVGRHQGRELPGA